MKTMKSQGKYKAYFYEFSGDEAYIKGVPLKPIKKEIQ